ncbi:response regulator transcription factor [Paenibacillus luteus]|uniref:response regulator transcription factor n=1 Tax=Paenibacillus luteus TaxID=2545753 RepID=UPI0011448027|nr:response regulator [Paenibacillus luteus]
MLKAVLFDDEFIVLKGLIKLIDWLECGVELVGTAKDGLSALSIFRQHRPDIVITDIRMPGLDGLELIEKIRTEAPDTMCIVFSGYNEFDYVKKAINLGVIDYLEKPITLEKVKDGIRKAVVRIQEQSEMSMLKRESKQQLLIHSTLQLLLRGEEAICGWEEQFGHEACKVKGITVLALSDEHMHLPNGPDYRLVPIKNGGEHLVVVFHFDLQSACWTESLENYTQATIGSGNTYSSVSLASISYKEAQRALRYGTYLEDKGWIKFGELGEAESINLHLTKIEDEVLFDMRIGDIEALMHKLDNYLDEFRKMKPDPEVAGIELMRMVFHALEVAKETGQSLAGLNPPGHLPERKLLGMQTLEEMMFWLREEIERIMHWIIDVRTRSKHAAVEKAAIYMNAHLGRDLTQQEVADHVGMNVTYFSLLFKEEMGVSYIKHLTKIRIEKSKAMLNEELSIQDISERVGYYHARHFSEVFKKQTGLTPGQFRSMGIGT